MKKSKQGAPDSARLSCPVGTDPAEVTQREGHCGASSPCRVRGASVPVRSAPVRVASANRCVLPLMEIDWGAAHSPRGDRPREVPDGTLSHLKSQIAASSWGGIRKALKVFTGIAQGVSPQNPKCRVDSHADMMKLVRLIFGLKTFTAKLTRERSNWLQMPANVVLESLDHFLETLS